jgi:hypothetical protein
MNTFFSVRYAGTEVTHVTVLRESSFIQQSAWRIGISPEKGNGHCVHLKMHHSDDECKHFGCILTVQGPESTITHAGRVARFREKASACSAVANWL